MKTSYKIIASILLVSTVSFGLVYALNGTKSLKLPWQGTPSGGSPTYYDSIHNVGSSYSADARFTLSASDTIVTDSITGLMWQSYKNTGSADYTGNYSTTKTWANAKTYCAGLSLGSYGVGSWRLPTVKELNSIVDFSVSSPSINGSFFGSQSYSYWSSTTYAPSTTYAWIVNFTNGSATNDDKTLNAYVRCVR